MAIDLSLLPPPNAVTPLNDVAILSEIKAFMIQHMPELEEDLRYESTVASKIARMLTLREVHKIAQINALWLSSSIVFATGPDLDDRAAMLDTIRLPDETDEDLRQRALLAFEKLSIAGPRDAYRYHALSTVWSFLDDDGNEWAETVVDAHVRSTVPGVVDVFVLGSGEKLIKQVTDDEPAQPNPNFNEGSAYGINVDGRYVPGNNVPIRVEPLLSDIPAGTVIHFSRYVKVTTTQNALEGATEIIGNIQKGGLGPYDYAGLLEAIRQKLSADTIRPLCDTVRVRKAVVETYAIALDVYIPNGPDSSIIEQLILSRLNKYAEDAFKLNTEIAMSAIYAQAHVPNVIRVVPASGGISQSLVANPVKAYRCSSIGVNVIVQ